MTTGGHRVWTPLAIIRWGTEYLREKDIDSPRLTVELLLAYVLQCRRIDLYTQYEKPLSQNELSLFKNVLQRRLAREPLQYILGTTEFMGIELAVSPSVFIPRPETERLAEMAMETCGTIAGGSEALTLLDIGTGSGNLAVSLLRYIPKLVCTAVDVSAEALEVAKRNAERHGVGDRMHLVEADVLTSVPDGTFNLIVSNPPYIPLDEYITLQPEITQFEPRIAATDGGDGLAFYRRIAGIGPALLAEGGACLVEIAYNQGTDVTAIFERAFARVTLEKDYSGHDRVVRGWRGDVQP